MRALNTIPRKEYYERLLKAMRRMSNKLKMIAEEERIKCVSLANDGKKESALRCAFNSVALDWAQQAIAMQSKQKESFTNMSIRAETIKRLNKKKITDMRRLCSIPQEEFAECLFEAAQRMRKRINHQFVYEEDSRAEKAENQGNEENALCHTFNAIALGLAADATLLTPKQIEEQILG